MQNKSKNTFLPSISIITPFYNEEEAIDLYFEKLITTLKEIKTDFEIICINDGSKDKTLAILKKWQLKIKQIKIIDFSRNFGKEAALTAGLDHATCQVTIPIDADLQDPPELVKEMITKWQEGFDVVLAKRKSRNDGFVRDLAAKVYYKILKWLTNGNMQEEVGDFRLLDQKVVTALRNMSERNRYMKGIFAWVGFRSITIYYDRPKRSNGDTKIGYFKLFRLAYDGLISFSTKPLKIWLYIGLFFSLFSFIYAIFLLLRTLIHGTDLPGYASIMVSVLFIGGLQLLSLGVIGEYIARIFKEVKHRPIYIVDNIYGTNKAKAPKKQKKPLQGKYYKPKA